MRWFDDRRAVRAILVVIAIPILLIASERVITSIFFTQSAGFTDSNGREIVFPTTTPEEQQRIVDDIIRDVLDDLRDGN